MLREARVHRARSPASARVPEVLAVGDDESVIGAPFYVMEKVDGPRRHERGPGAARHASRTGGAWASELVDALVEIHAVDWQAAGLEGFGKPTGYLERQLRRFIGLWEHNKTREIDAVERVGGWLRDNLPESPPATIVHGDFRLGNVMMAPEAPARLDRDLRLGDGDDRRPARRPRLPVHAVDRPRRPDLGHVRAVGGHARRRASPRAPSSSRATRSGAGRSMTDIRWYQTLALWKSIVFMEGNYKRAVSGTTDDPFLKTFGDGVIAARRARRGDRAWPS